MLFGFLRIEPVPGKIQANSQRGVPRLPGILCGQLQGPVYAAELAGELSQLIAKCFV